MVTRVNSYTGVKYSDDATIMMWDVLNEPRCPGCSGGDERADQQGWLSRMADHVKGQAPNQLVATGTEGYFTDGAPELQ
jgi:mannan endo-1,4-beta-mannosidase